MDTEEIQSHRKFLIYGHKNKVNGKWYIGQTCQNPPTKRWQSGHHYTSCVKFYSAIKKYGWDSFEHIILEEVDESIVDEREIFYINFYDSIENGYNLVSGGKHRTVISEETRRRMSEAQMGEKNHNYGKPKSEEFKQKVREKRKNFVVTEEMKRRLREISLRRGPLTEEHKRKMMEGRRPLSDEERGRISEKLKEYYKTHSNPKKGKPLSEETKAKMKASMKYRTYENSKRRKLLCIELGKEFSSVKEATEFLGLKGNASILSACKDGREAGGYHWKYLEDDNYSKRENQNYYVKVRCIETGEVFNYLKEAGDKIGIKNPNAISDACKGILKTVGGYHWEFVDYTPRKNKKGVICIETGEEFDTIKAAAEKYQMNEDTIKYRLKHPNPDRKGFNWKYKDDE